MNIKQINRIGDISGTDWNRLAGTDYPFLRHEYLSALELSGCVSEATGWQPQHVLIYEGVELVACCPLYLKFHSHGEFVFDQQWAQAYQQQGLRYYPKWLTAVPFTPCQSRRILIKQSVDESVILKFMVEAIQELSTAQKISSWHCLFTSLKQIEQLEQFGCLVREGVQFQWFNQQYRDFQDYCSTFASRKRKTILRERESVKVQGIAFLYLSGSEVTESQWQVFYNFYQMTYLKHGMSAYLNLAFFKLLAQTMPEQLLLILAHKEGVYVGAALSFIGSDSFYGRYWGCFEEYPYLHFEACYYQGLDYCIKKGLQRFDSGAQGEHKIARGFEPVSTYSAHWIKDERFAAAIQQFLQREQPFIQQYKLDCAGMLPFRKTLDSDSNSQF